MKFFYRGKDGGPESTVTGYWLVEIKNLFSICLLRFDGNSREAFHTHAFNALSWVLKGHLVEIFMLGRKVDHPASWRPFITRRSDFHKVDSVGTSWVLTFRGPWNRVWFEYLPGENNLRMLKNGRVLVES